MTTTNFTDKLIQNVATGRAPSVTLAEALYAKFGECRFRSCDLAQIVLHPEQCDGPEDIALCQALNQALIGAPRDDLQYLGQAIGFRLRDLSRHSSGDYAVEKVPGPRPANKHYWHVKKSGF